MDTVLTVLSLVAVGVILVLILRFWGKPDPEGSAHPDAKLDPEEEIKNALKDVPPIRASLEIKTPGPISVGSMDWHDKVVDPLSRGIHLSPVSEMIFAIRRGEVPDVSLFNSPRIPSPDFIVDEALLAYMNKVASPPVIDSAVTLAQALMGKGAAAALTAGVHVGRVTCALVVFQMQYLPALRQIERTHGRDGIFTHPKPEELIAMLQAKPPALEQHLFGLTQA